MRFSVQPHDYAMDLQAMTKEKLQFRLPVVFTVGPDVNQRGANGQSNNGKAPTSGDVHPVSGVLDGENEQEREDRGDSLMKYAVLLADSNGKKSKTNNNQFLEGIVRSVIELAKANAAAVQGLQPKISLWNTGNQAGDAGGQPTGVDAIRNIYQMLPPLVSTIQEQTGLVLPEWQFGRLANQTSVVEKEGKHAHINGVKK